MPLKWNKIEKKFKRNKGKWVQETNNKMLDYDSANLGSGSISFELWVKANIFALIVILKNIIVVLDVISCPAEL